MLSNVGNSLVETHFFRFQTFTLDIHRSMSMLGQSKKYIAACLHYIRTERIQAPGRPSFLMCHHPTNLEASTRLTKSYCSSKNYIQFNSLPLDLLHKNSMGHSGLVHHNKLKPVLEQLTKHNTVLGVSNSYKLEYTPFDYYKHYNVIQYGWVDRRLGPHILDCDHELGKISHDQTRDRITPHDHSIPVNTTTFNTHTHTHFIPTPSPQK